MEASLERVGDPSLEAITAKNGGIFTRQQAVACGWEDRDLATAVRRGSLRRLLHGVYSPTMIYDASDEVGRHVLLARAALACQRGQAALTGISAAAVHGLTLYDQDLTTVHLVRLDRGAARSEVKINHHRVTRGLRDDLEVVAGLPVVSVARTVWEVATQSSLEGAVCTADSALRRHPDLLHALRAQEREFDQRPGSRTARLAMRLASNKCDSPGESLSRVLFFRRGVPAPEPQFEVRDSDGKLLGIADFYWPSFHHLGEFDGKAKYERLLRPGEAPADAVFREKRREDAMRSTARGMTRWTWQDLMPMGSIGFIRRLFADLEQSSRLYAGRAA